MAGKDVICLWVGAVVAEVFASWRMSKWGVVGLTEVCSIAVEEVIFNVFFFGY